MAANLWNRTLDTSPLVEVPLVRVQTACLTGDVFEPLRCDCGAQLRAASNVPAEQTGGILVYVPGDEGRIGLADRAMAYVLQDQGLDTVDANPAPGFPPTTTTSRSPCSRRWVCGGCGC